MTRAVISLGTNTTRLLVVRDLPGGAVEQLEHAAIGTRLGEGLRESGNLADAAMERTLDAVRSFVVRVREHDARSVAIATSAMRRAKNASQFAAQLEHEIGAPLQILTGEEEAACSFRGATAGSANDGVRRAVLDIGGGSTECAVGANGAIEATFSIEIGSVRLTEQFPDLAGGVPGTRARTTADSARVVVADTLQVVAGFRPIGELLAVAGTPLTLGAVILNATVDTVSGRTLTRRQIDDTCDRLLDLPLAGRKALPGMLPQRADVLPAGGIILTEVMRLLETDTAKLESNDLLLGFLLRPK